MNKAIQEYAEAYAVYWALGEPEEGKERERFVEAQKEVEMIGNWRPVETAPKDGRDVLAGFQSTGSWVTAIAMATKSYGVYANGYSKFTHWMPLPIPPNSTE